MKKKSCSTKKECCCPCQSKWILLILAVLVAIAATYLGLTRTKGSSDFKIVAERFGDMQVLRYQVPGFEQLPVKQKELVYYLTQAALSGYDIFYDQNYKHNLCLRRTLEGLWKDYTGDRKSEEFSQFATFIKLFWTSRGIHDGNTFEKIKPQFSEKYFAELIKQSAAAKFPLNQGETLDAFIHRLTPLIFNPKIGAKKVNLDEGADFVANSATNLYEGLTQKEVEDYYAKIVDKTDPTPVLYGLNSKLMKINGTITEIPWKVGGMYSAAIEKIVFWLNKAVTVAENEEQKEIRLFSRSSG